MEFFSNKIKKFLFLILRILYIQYMAFVEMHDLIWLKFKKFHDYDYKKMEIRHLAHKIEKILQTPTGMKINRKKNNGDFRRLQEIISSLEKDRMYFADDVKWARMICKEFESYLVSGQRCKLLGRVEKEIPGLQEVQDPNGKNDKIANIDLVELIKGRRSIRDWIDEPVSEEQIDLLVEAARWAPSSCNRQTCRYIMIQDKRKIEKIALTVKGGYSFFHKAPLLIIVVNDIRRYQFPDEKHVPYQDSAASIQNMLLLAHRIGLGACWASYTSDTLLILRERKVRRVLNLPHYYKISGIVAVGKPNMRVCIIPRLDKKEILFT